MRAPIFIIVEKAFDIIIFGGYNIDTGNTCC